MTTNTITPDEATNVFPYHQAGYDVPYEVMKKVAEPLGLTVLRLSEPPVRYRVVDVATPRAIIAMTSTLTSIIVSYFSDITGHVIGYHAVKNEAFDVWEFQIIAVPIYMIAEIYGEDYAEVPSHYCTLTEELIKPDVEKLGLTNLRQAASESGNVYLTVADKAAPVFLEQAQMLMRIEESVPLPVLVSTPSRHPHLTFFSFPATEASIPHIWNLCDSRDGDAINMRVYWHMEEGGEVVYVAVETNKTDFAYAAFATQLAKVGIRITHKELEFSTYIPCLQNAHYMVMELLGKVSGTLTHVQLPSPEDMEVALGRRSLIKISYKTKD